MTHRSLVLGLGHRSKTLPSPSTPGSAQLGLPGRCDVPKARLGPETSGSQRSPATAATRLPDLHSSQARMARSAFWIGVLGLSALLALGACSDDTSAEIAGVGGPGVNPDVAGQDGGPTGDAPAAAACGDGVCDPGESALTCREDCPADGTMRCLAKACGTAWQACLGSGGCTSGLACWLNCDGEAGCQDACVLAADAAASFILTNVLECGGGADCWSAAGGLDSCAGRCDTFDDGAACSCDESCATFGDCCSDYAELCTGTGPECGNSVCEPPEETRESCAADCAGGGPICGDGTCEGPETPQSCPDDCRGQGQCGDGVCGPRESFDDCPADCDPPTGVVGCVEDACPTEVADCQAVPACAQGLVCSAACAGDDIQCFLGCFQDAGFGGEVISLGLCAQQSGCFQGGGPGPQPTCGDGQCDQGETANNCPQDCAGGGPGGCGDGVCDQFEQFTCPQDCEGGNSDCGNGVCDQFEQFSCPQDCQEDPQTAAELLECLEGACGPETQACRDNPNCGVQIECLEACDDDPDCVDECVALGSPTDAGTALTACAQEAQCFGGGGPGPNPGGFCGDGVCDGPEDANSCPDDCAGGPGPGPGGVGAAMVQCLESGCGQEFAACESDQQCGAALTCIEGCPDQDCVLSCVQQAGFGGPVINLAICAQQAGCF